MVETRGWFADIAKDRSGDVVTVGLHVNVFRFRQDRETDNPVAIEGRNGGGAYKYINTTKCGMNGRRGRLQREQAIKRCQRSEAMN